jgi:hypothetical protein
MAIDALAVHPFMKIEVVKAGSGRILTTFAHPQYVRSVERPWMVVRYMTYSVITMRLHWSRNGLQRSFAIGSRST